MGAAASLSEPVLTKQFMSQKEPAMFSKVTSATVLAMATGLVALTISLGLIASSVRAQSGGQPCEMKWAKGSTTFAAGTEFSVRQLHKTYTYTCDGDIGQWNEAVTWLIPPVRVSD